MHTPDTMKSQYMNPMRSTHPSSPTEVSTASYKAMPFDIKNPGATYQKLVNGMFKDLIGKSMEGYVDDMLVKSKIAGDHIKHLNQMFNSLRKYQMKLI